jgi:hypothetical protein
MTESEWLTGGDSTTLLVFLRGKASDRKYRLWACAVCRRAWKLLRFESSRAAVVVAERYADGQATRAECEAAEQACSDELRRAREEDTISTSKEFHYRFWTEEKASYTLLQDCYPIPECCGSIASDCWMFPSPESKELEETEPEDECNLVRDIFGNPFRPVTMNPSWLRWNDGTVVKIAQGLYEERAFDRLPILHDALLDAGCDDEDILAHCLSEGPHVRGCWVIDLILATDR